MKKEEQNQENQTKQVSPSENAMASHYVSKYLKAKELYLRIERMKLSDKIKDKAIKDAKEEYKTIRQLYQDALTDRE